MADSTIPQDVIGQTTLPPILFRTSTTSDTTDTDTDTDTTDADTDTTDADTDITDTDTNTSISNIGRTASIENQTTPHIQPELSRELLSRSEPELGWKSTVADTSTMGSDTTLVPTDELVSVGTPVPEVGEHTVDHLVKIPSKVPQEKGTYGNAEMPRRFQQTVTTDLTETLTISTPASGNEDILRKDQLSTFVTDTETVTTPQSVPEYLKPLRKEVAKPISVPNVSVPSKVQQTSFAAVTETLTISQSVTKTVTIPSQVHTVSIPQSVPIVQIPSKIIQQAETTPALVPKTVSRLTSVTETVPIPSNEHTVSIPSKVHTVPIPQLVAVTPKTSPEKLSDSFVPPTVQIMAYVIDALWEKEHKNLDDGYKVTEDMTERKDDLEDDDMSKPVFQTNVPIVNEESVPMRMHMDIIPQGFPEDLEGPMYYPDYYDDKDGTKNDLDKFTKHPLGKDPDDSGDTGDVDRFVKIQQQMRFFRFSDTFDKLVELHRNLAVYARNHDIKMFKGFSDRITDVLQKHTDNAAEQLVTVVSMISDEIDDEPLNNSLKKFLGNLSESNSESSLVLSNLPALRYS